MYPLNPPKRLFLTVKRVHTLVHRHRCTGKSQCHVSQGPLLTEDEARDRQRRSHATLAKTMIMEMQCYLDNRLSVAQLSRTVQIVQSARTMKTFIFLVKSSDTTKSMTGTGDTFWEIYGLAPQNMGDTIIPK